MVRTMILAAAATILVAGTAQAQKVGTYSGTAADGTYISFTVDKNGTAGAFRFANGDVNFEAQCTHPSRVASEGWGFFVGQDIVAGANPFHSGNDYYDTAGSMHFVNNNTLAGTITSVTAVFVPGSTPPVNAQFCKSAKQAFTLHWSAAPGRTQYPTATVLEKRRTN
ncbi:MAG: hypothetical protein JOZ72_14175 [Alphaproteobacteria bacterium]|nr:hypothetical protein [Alphaproteobacteria bacterium]